jgi:cbb3-type cytochrome oxidase subunit 3
MYKNVLQAIDGIAIYPIISFLIFFVFFLGLTLFVIFSDKKHIAAMSQMPLQNDPQSSVNKPRNKPSALAL